MTDNRKTTKRTPAGRKKFALAAATVVAAVVIAGASFAAGSASTAGRISELEAAVDAASARSASLDAEKQEALEHLDDLTLERDELAADLEATEGLASDLREALDAESAPPSGSDVSSLIGGSVLNVIEAGSGRVEIETNIVDPRGEDGSPAAREAIAICERADAIEGVETVAVYESDGTTFVVRNDSFGPGCIEV